MLTLFTTARSFLYKWIKRALKGVSELTEFENRAIEAQN